MRRGFAFVSWGFFALIFHVNIGSISLLPSFAGFLLIAYGAHLLPGSVREFCSAKRLACALAAYSFLTTFLSWGDVLDRLHWLNLSLTVISTFLELLLASHLLMGAARAFREAGNASKAIFLEKALCVNILLQTVAMVLYCLFFFTTDARESLIYVTLFMLFLVLFILALLYSCWRTSKNMEEASAPAPKDAWPGRDIMR